MEQKLSDKELYDLTSINECLNVTIHEYDVERNKKQSFDNRAGLIITVLSAIFLAIYNKIPINGVLSMVVVPLTFKILVQIIINFLIYIFLCIALYYAIRIIFVKKNDGFDVSILDDDFIAARKIEAVSKLTEIYLTLVIKHREKNEYIAKQLEKSQKTMIISILLVIIYLNLF